jgi:hypothetical protein
MSDEAGDDVDGEQFEDFPTVTMHATGEAIRVQRVGTDDTTITTEATVTFDATIPLDHPDDVEAIGHLSKHGFAVIHNDVWTVVDDHLPVDHELQSVDDFDLSARVDDWTRVASTLVGRQRQPFNSKSAKARRVCRVLDGVAEHAGDRARLARYDVASSYDVDSVDVEAIGRELAGEVTADSD